jgi:hypothetical protein
MKEKIAEPALHRVELDEQALADVRGGVYLSNYGLNVPAGSSAYYSATLLTPNPSLLQRMQMADRVSNWESFAFRSRFG